MYKNNIAEDESENEGIEYPALSIGARNQTCFHQLSPCIEILY